MLDVGLLRAMDAQQLKLLRDSIATTLSQVETYLGLAEHTERERARYAERIEAMKAARPRPRVPRNIEIMRLARRGYSNSDIGKRVGLSAGQVSRIIRNELRIGRLPEAQATPAYRPTTAPERPAAAQAKPQDRSAA